MRLVGVALGLAAASLPACDGRPSQAPAQPSVVDLGSAQPAASSVVPVASSEDDAGDAAPAASSPVTFASAPPTGGRVVRHADGSCMWFPTRMPHPHNGPQTPILTPIRPHPVACPPADAGD